MKNVPLPGAFLVLLLVFCGWCGNAEASVMEEQLSSKEQAVVKVAAFTATGRLPQLKVALAAALDEGWKVNEVKEVLVQLYAYCGFPRALNGLSCYMSLLEERRSAGINDVLGMMPSPVPAGESLKLGTANQERLCGHKVTGALYDFAPAIDQFLKGHLFGDIFGRGVLDWRTREIVTVAALAAMEGVDGQLKAHLGIAANNGVTQKQLQAIVETAKLAGAGLFPTGKPNDAYAKYFSGRSFIAGVTTDKRLNTPVANVTFEPGCRNNWHSHTGGQILVGVSGVGYYQERGKVARKILPGTVVEIPPDVEHWHGASPDSWFSHLAIECNPQTNRNTWLEPVSEGDYRQAVNSAP